MKQLKGKLHKMDKEGTKWKAVINMGLNPATKKYERKVRIFYGNSREADYWYRNLMAELEDEESNPYSAEPVSEWLDYWIENYGKAILNWEQNTLERAQRIINKNIKPYIGHIPLRELQAQHIVDFYACLSKSGKTITVKTPEGSVKEQTGLSPRTIQYVHTVLNQSLNQAADLGKIEISPTKSVKPAKDKRKAREKWIVLDEKQLAKFLQNCKHHRDYSLIYIAAFTGARQSELLGLTWDSVLWDKKSIQIEQALHLDKDNPEGFEHRPRTKNDTSTRIITVTDRVLEVLNECKKMQIEKGLNTNMVFTEPDGSLISRDNLGHRFSDLATKYGHLGMTFHHLRHTHATILLSNGANVNEVAERLGHADPKITLGIYGHVLPGRHQTLADRFDLLIDTEDE